MANIDAAHIPVELCGFSTGERLPLATLLGASTLTYQPKDHK